MSLPTTVTIQGSEIRVDRNTGYVCITDIGNAKDAGGGKEFVSNWLRNANTVGFFEAWERKHNPSFKGVEFDAFKKRAGLNSFRLSAGELIEAGATGIIAKRGRYGGTYCAIGLTINFTNWLDPVFYVETVDNFLELSNRIHGKDAIYQRFARELAAENYGMITQANAKRKIPRMPHSMASTNLTGDKKLLVQRHLNQVDADIINLAIWGLTAAQWRQQFPEAAGKGQNLRDHAHPIELKILVAIQVLMRHLQEDGYTAEEKLDRLRNKAKELVPFYCKTPEDLAAYGVFREERGW